MFNGLREFGDRLLGRGSAAITVPVMDGTLRPNRVLDDAELVASLDNIDDLASDGQQLWASAGSVLYRLHGSELVELRRFDQPISALAISASGRLALALGGREVQVFDAAAAVGNAGSAPSARLAQLDAGPMGGVNALVFESDNSLLISDGSMRRGPDEWCHDLMELGRSGRVARWTTSAPQAEVLARDLAYAFGVLPDAAQPGDVFFAESWRHRVQRFGAGGTTTLLAELPGYPSRMTPARDGGFWLSCFVCRTQLVEFVLREPAYRQRMMAEIEPRHWIAPTLSSGHSFMEPLQGAGVKQMGVLKPWAPPRSYGLVLRIGSDGRVLRSLHSQVDGRHHGITAVAECGGALYAASKGSGRLLRVALDGGEGDRA